MTLNGQEGTSEKILLPNDIELYERGMTDEFKVHKIYTSVLAGNSYLSIYIYIYIFKLYSKCIYKYSTYIHYISESLHLYSLYCQTWEK